MNIKALFTGNEAIEPIPGLIADATDYHIYQPTLQERILWQILGFLGGAVVLYIFYESIILSIILGIICSFAFVPIRTRQVIKKRQSRLNLQFRSLLQALSTSMSAGAVPYTAFMNARTDLRMQYTTDTDIIKEIDSICLGLKNNLTPEALLQNFAQRSGLDDVKNFADVYSACSGRTNEIGEVVKNTSDIIGDKIEIQMEIETMVSGQVAEQNIMLVMPVVFVFLLKGMGGSMVDLNSPIGVFSVTVALIIFIAAYFVSKKILDIKM